jgi:pullulanase/glycogen debranching enzyme
VWIDEERAHNFSLYSRHADRVTLLLFGEEDAARPAREVVLFCLLFLANGIPMFGAGNEFMRTPGSIARSMSLIRDKKSRRPRSDTGSWPDQW